MGKKGSQAESVPSEFVKMEKDGEVIEVHPETVQSHKNAGWAIVE